jgi:hypothetical protein
MAFNPASLPPDVYSAYKLGPLNWPVVVKTAVQRGLTDLDWLASVVFYLHHPERNGQQIAAHETPMITQWKGFRTLIKPMVPEMSKPDPPKGPKSEPAVSDWVLTPEEEQDLRQYGREVVEWAKTPPMDDVESYEFLVPQHLRDDYKVVFAWKSTNPKIKCAADSRQTRLKVLAMVRDDMDYWMRAMKGDRRAATIRRQTAETTIRDYRRLIVDQKMCPQAAYNHLVKMSKDLIYEMILGLWQLMTIRVPGGVVTNGPPKLLKKIHDALKEE